jgi:hypothetical protein
MNKENRRMCKACSIDTITQGSIFNNAFNEEFNGDDDLGMLISARCDMANNKSPKFSYLPVIKLEKYILHFVSKKLFNEQCKEEINKIKSLIENEGGSTDLVDIYGIETSIKKILVKPKNITKANDAHSKITRLMLLKDKMWHELVDKDLELIPKKKFKNELLNLSENKTEGFFLLDDVVDFNSSSESEGPHVVLLREIHHMSSDICELIKKGCDYDELLLEGGVPKSLNIKPGEMSYVYCNVTSPYIELIMQRFSNLFTRIGVEDPSKIMVDKFVNDYISD